MAADPFTADGSAREREQRLFDFLARQAAAPAPGTWRQLAEATGRTDDLGYLALLLSNLTEGDRARAGASETLYRLAQELLGPKLSPAPYEAWFKKGMVDVPRLAGFLEDTARAEAAGAVNGVPRTNALRQPRCRGA